jgi:hypothetical protein
MRARAVVLLALLAASLAAACGSGKGKDNDQYVTALNRAQTGLAQRFGALQARITPTSSAKQDEKTLRAYEAAVRDAVTALRGVSPPDGLSALHQRFIGQVADYGAALKTARSELRGDDPQAILAAQGRLRTAVAKTGTRLNATIQAINQKLKD